MRIAVIGDRGAVAGFALGGVSVRHVVNGEEDAREAFENVLSQDDIAVLLVTQTCASILKEDIDRLRDRKLPYPVVVILPPRDDEAKEEDRIGILIKKAVGISMTQQDKGGEKYG